MELLLYGMMHLSNQLSPINLPVFPDPSPPRPPSLLRTLTHSPPHSPYHSICNPAVFPPLQPAWTPCRIKLLYGFLYLQQCGCGHQSCHGETRPETVKADTTSYVYYIAPACSASIPRLGTIKADSHYSYSLTPCTFSCTAYRVCKNKPTPFVHLPNINYMYPSTRRYLYQCLGTRLV